MSHDDRFSTRSGEPDWEAIARAMAGEATSQDREAFGRHLDANPGRGELVGAMDGAASRLAAQQHAEIDVETALAAVMARRDLPPADVIPFRSRTHSRPESRWRGAALRAAAAVILMVGGALVWRVASPDRGAPLVTYATDAGRVRAIRLADGTRVQLGPASTLTVAAGYGGASRETLLRGEAYFEVVHDDARPFVVRTPTAVVRDLGTAFTVAGDSGVATDVVVTSGTVAIGAGAGAESVLSAGDRGTVTAGGQVSVERGAATPEDVAWTRGRLVFRNAPLGQVAAAVQRWYGVTLVVSDPGLAHRRITATFETTQRPDDVLQVLAATMGGELRRRGDRAEIVPTAER